MPLLPSADVPRQRYNQIAGSYVVSDDDNGTMLECSGGNIELSAAATQGTVVYVRRTSSAPVLFSPGAGTTLQSQGNLRQIAAQWVVVTCDKRSATEWVLSGSLA